MEKPTLYTFTLYIAICRNLGPPSVHCTATPVEVSSGMYQFPCTVRRFSGGMPSVTRIRDHKSARFVYHSWSSKLSSSTCVHIRGSGTYCSSVDLRMDQAWTLERLMQQSSFLDIVRIRVHAASAVSSNTIELGLRHLDATVLYAVRPR